MAATKSKRIPCPASNCDLIIDVGLLTMQDEDYCDICDEYMDNAEEDGEYDEY